MPPRRRPALGVALVVLGALLTVAPTTAIARERAGNHCVNLGGDDLNAIFGTTDAIVAPFCTEVGVGDRWRAALRLNVAGADRVFPAGYEPSRPHLDDDFLVKFVSMTYVIDAGTRRERVLAFPTSRLVLRTGALPDGTRFIGWVSPRFSPLPPGDHTVDQYVTLSDDFWDGLGRDPVINSIPDGQSFAASFTFRVVDQRP